MLPFLIHLLHKYSLTSLINDNYCKFGPKIALIGPKTQIFVFSLFLHQSGKKKMKIGLVGLQCLHLVTF